MSSPSVRAAATQIELHPVAGARLTGFANRLEPSIGSHDPLMAKVLLVDDGSCRIVWISCDLIGFSVEDDAELRGLVASELGISPAHVLVSCTHTHSGPSSMPFRGALGEVDRGWLTRTFRAIAQAAAALPARLRRAALAHATTTVNGLGYNRQDGVSPIDERLLVAQLRDEEHGHPIATILNYATHPVVLGDQNRLFSADYPGYATRRIEQETGGVGVFLLGAAGDVDPALYRDQGRQAGTCASAREMGEKLAGAAVSALADATSPDVTSILVAEEAVETPLDPPPSLDEIRAFKRDRVARRGRADKPPTTDQACWAMFELAWAEELERALERGTVPRKLSSRISALAMGALRVVAFPFELYSQIGRDIRQRVEPCPTIIAGYTNGLIGYVPTARAKAQGGYGPALSHRFFPQLLTPIAAGADTMLVEAAVSLLARCETRDTEARPRPGKRGS